MKPATTFLHLRSCRTSSATGERLQKVLVLIARHYVEDLSTPMTVSNILWSSFKTPEIIYSDIPDMQQEPQLFDLSLQRDTSVYLCSVRLIALQGPCHKHQTKLKYTCIVCQHHNQTMYILPLQHCHRAYTSRQQGCGLRGIRPTHITPTPTTQVGEDPKDRGMAFGEAHLIHIRPNR